LIIKVFVEPRLLIFLDPSSKMNKPVKNRRRESLLAGRLRGGIFEQDVEQPNGKPGRLVAEIRG
jgi:hypothetical protein